MGLPLRSDYLPDSAGGKDPETVYGGSLIRILRPVELELRLDLRLGHR